MVIYGVLERPAHQNEIRSHAKKPMIYSFVHIDVDNDKGDTSFIF